MAQANPTRQTAAFEEIPIKVGERWQMQPAGTVQPTHYAVRYMGALKNASILCTLPIIDHEGMWMRSNGEYIFRVLAGSHVYAFVSRLLKARAHPYPYAHFDYPERVQTRQVRNSPRVELHLKSQADKLDGSRVTLVFLDLSLDGALVEAEGDLGEPGDSVRVTLPIYLSEVNRELKLEADIRNRTPGERPRYGLAFHGLENDQRLMLHFFIDHLMAERMGDGA